MSLQEKIQFVLWVEFVLLFPIVLGFLIFLLKNDKSKKSEATYTGENSKIVINTSKDTDELYRDTEGYVTIEIQEEKKSLFHDLLKGFEEYATLKGYKVSVSIDASEEGKISFKIVVHDFGVTANRKIIKKDLDEYLEMIKSGDLDKIPEVLEPVEHARIVMALKNRIVFLQQNYQVERNIREFYEKFFERIPLQSISHANPILHITNSGSSEMDQRKYIANNSANTMQGDNHSNRFRTGNVTIGTTYTEKKEQIEKIEELLDELKKTDIKGQHDAVRHVENAKEELSESENPDQGQVEKYLGKAGKILAAAEKGSALFLKAKSVFDSFSISF